MDKVAKSICGDMGSNSCLCYRVLSVAQQLLKILQISSCFFMLKLRFPKTDLQKY